MKRTVLSLFLLSAVPCWAASVTVGGLVFVNPLTTGLQGFQIVNSTGPLSGCDAGSAIPVCTVLSFQLTSLMVTFDDASTAVRTPSGDYSFAPGTYIYGNNLGDDPAQSFLFPDTLNIVSATFSGSLSPASFVITNSDSLGQLSTFFSGGVFTVSLDLSGAPPIAGADITVNEAQPTNTVPEPGTAILFLCFLMFRVLFQRKSSLV